MYNANKTDRDQSFEEQSCGINGGPGGNKSYPLCHMSKHNKSIKHITNVKNESRLKIQEL